MKGLNMSQTNIVNLTHYSVAETFFFRFLFLIFFCTHDDLLKIKKVR